MHFSKQEIEEIKSRIMMGGVKDSDFELITSVSNNDFVAIVSNGSNRRLPFSSLRDFIVLIDTTENWNNATGYIPPRGQIIVYSDAIHTVIDGEDVYSPAIKIGSGNGYVQDLVFTESGFSQDFIDHIGNQNIHVTATDKSSWDNKLNIDDSQEVVMETLIFNRN